jgi:OOP family OmpA-OmpF porin
MKKLNKVASLFATAALATSMSGAFAQTVDNWVSGQDSKLPWKNGTNELCWRNGFWTPATANAQCDGALAPAAAPTATPAAPAAPVVSSEKVTFAADTLFDFDKAVLKPEGKAKLDDLVSKLNGINLEVVIAVGHTDSFGSDKYNDRLSVRRAEAVKGYLVSKGIEANRVYTEGKGKRQLKVDPKSCKGARKAQIACQQPNRRVDVEVVGTRKAQ